MAAGKTNNTPGRRKRTGNQYFEVGKVGRKTGITLKDTGIRDEHGLEPVSGIFSSPAENGDKTLTSEGMDVDESMDALKAENGRRDALTWRATGSAPDVTATLTQRKTPRLPLPRQSTPKHTNIGSPKRMSSARPTSRKENVEEVDSPRANSQPPANRRLNFGATTRNRQSISVVDTQSPFKPRNVLRRSTGPGRADPYDIQDDEDETSRTNADRTEHLPEDEDVEPSIEDNDAPLMYDNSGSYTIDDGDVAIPAAELEEIDPTEAPASSNSPLKKKRGRPRKSDQSLVDHSQLESSAGKKRGRASLDHSRTIDESTTSIAQSSMRPPSKRQRASNGDRVMVHHDEGIEVVDPATVAYGDEYAADGDIGDAPQESLSDAQAQLDSQLADQDPKPSQKRGRQGKKGKAAAAKAEGSDPARKSRGSPTKANGSPSKLQRGGSAGPFSNVNLRATTPFEDAGQQTSRFGRNLIQPLKFWENEARIWKSGEIEGIIRAEHVDKLISKKKSKGRKGRKGRSRLDDIEEESDTESILPDEWENTIGVISGSVAGWDPAGKAGDPNSPVDEDLAFAASSIITRDVAGSDFKYAKIMTIPFFGAGVVELPPDGFKRAKNSRRMQMVFFVHEGKVMVEVSATGLEVNKFALSKGGVWVVPRGNNYAISNESRTRDAKIFFAQGCEVEASAA